MDELYEVYNEFGNTLLDLVKISGNAVVTQYLEGKFGTLKKSSKQPSKSTDISNGIQFTRFIKII